MPSPTKSHHAQSHTARHVAIVIALLGSTALALAQGSTAQSSGMGPDASSTKEGQVPGPNVTTPANTSQQEQSIQPAPGAMPDSDTVPSTISAKNAAHDKLPTTAYRIFTLTDGEKHDVHQALKQQPETIGSADAGVEVQIGTELPASIMLKELPDDIGAKLPVLQGAKYTRAGDTVLLVEPRNRIVIGVLR